MAEPISPQEVVQAKIAAIPDAVIEVFNELIARSWSGRKATVPQQLVIEALLERAGDVGVITREQIFDRHLLDVEPIYRDAGWAVEYDKPGFNESYEPVFTFSVPRKS